MKKETIKIPEVFYAELGRAGTGDKKGGREREKKKKTSSADASQGQSITSSREREKEKRANETKEHFAWCYCRMHSANCTRHAQVNLGDQLKQ